MQVSQGATYTLEDKNHCDVLKVGKNVIGRSSAPVEGVSFINIESHRTAISRMQAFIEIASNGDAWICDCNSTNGTYLSIRGGLGIRLEPNHYYQLTPNCLLTFGDVERKFVVVQKNSKVCLTTQEKAMSLCNHDSPEKVSMHIGENAKNNSSEMILEKNLSVSKENHSKTSTPRPHSPRKVPYLAELQSTEREATELTKTSGSPERCNTAQSRKRTRSRPSETIKVSPRLIKTTTPTTNTLEAKSKTFAVCVSGMDSKQRGVVQQLLKKKNGKIVEDITKANLLIVPVPATRTPKFIIAVGRGIPIVHLHHLEEVLKDEEIGKYIVSLKHVDVEYSADILRHAIIRQNNIPILKNLEFYIGGLSIKQRGTAQEIIIGCGGKVNFQKGQFTIDIADRNLNMLYDSIIRGQRPTIGLGNS